MSTADDGSEDWEEWNPSKISFINHLFAGSCAGLAEHVSLFPIDTIKTHVQCEKCGSVSPLQTWNCATRIVGNEGFFRLWRGVSAMFAGCIPAHAAYFSVYEMSKKLFGADKEGHHPLAAAFCGAVATFSHDCFMSPFDLIKQRMQLGFHQNFLECAHSIIRREGFRALYISFPTTLLMNIPYGCIMVPVNESVKKYLNSNSNRYNMSSSIISGAIAGGVAGAFTNPLDVIKTRLQTINAGSCVSPGMNAHNDYTFESSMDHHSGKLSLHSKSSLIQIDKIVQQNIKSIESLSNIHTNTTDPIIKSNPNNVIENAPINRSSILKSVHSIKSILHISREIFAEYGWKGFTRGLLPRVMVHAPAVAISWTTYEWIKNLM